MDFFVLPRFLQVELTYACNSQCSFCYNPTHKGKLDKAALLRALEQVNSFEVRHVQLIGGEVTLLEPLPEYLAALNQVRRRSIVTNGRIFRPDIEGLIDEAYVSVHGDRRMHEWLTSEPGSYAVIEKTIDRYVSLGITVYSDTVLTKYNFDQVYEIAQHAKELGMRGLFLNIFQPEGIGSKRPDFSPSLNQIRLAITQMIRARDELDFPMQFGTSTPFCLDERLITKQLAFRCGAGEWFGSISPSGELRICNHSTRSYGNIREDPLNRIWHLRDIDADYRNASLDGVCAGCAFFSECRGGCRINEAGSYRVDPVVMRDEAQLVPKPRLAELRQTYEVSPFPLSCSA